MVRELSNEELASAIVEAQKQGLSEVVVDLEQEILRRQNDTMMGATTDILSKRGQAIADIAQEPVDYRDLTTGFVGKGARIVGGEVIGGAAEIVGEGVERSGLLETAPFRIAPDVLPVVSFMQYLGSTEAGQEFARAFDKGNEYLQEWGKRGPENARLLKIAEGFLNIGIQAPGRSVLPTVRGADVEQVGDFFTTRGQTRKIANRKEELSKYFAPDRSKADARDIEQVSRLSGRTVWNPKDKLTSDALDYAVTNLPKLTAGNPFTARNVLTDNLTRLENQLITGLRKSQVRVNPADIIKELEFELQKQFNTKQWKDRPEARAAGDLFDVAVDRIQKGDRSLESLLLLRRELDSLFGNKKDFYTGDQTKIGSGSLRTIRNALNQIVDREATDVDVSDLLTQQSYSLRLLEHLEPKIIKSAESRLARIGQTISPFISQTGPGLAATVSAAGAAATAVSSSPSLMTFGVGAGLGVPLFGVGYLATRPATEKALGNMLKATGLAIKSAEKSGASELVAQLKADRLFLIDLMQNTTAGTEVTFEDEDE